MQEAKHANVLRFGVFDVDLRSGELRKSGSKISLQEQPFKILTALLEHPGEVVTREELRSLIWPQESFGDFDHAVCVAVAKLRTALGDSADVPRYESRRLPCSRRTRAPLRLAFATALEKQIRKRKR